MKISEIDNEQMKIMLKEGKRIFDKRDLATREELAFIKIIQKIIFSEFTFSENAISDDEKIFLEEFIKRR